MIKSIFSRKEFLIGFGFVVLDLVFLIVGGWLLTHQVIKSSQQLSDRKFALDNNLKASQTMYKDRQEMEKKKEEIDKIKQSFIAKNEPIGFINLMEDLAQKTNNLYKINLLPQLSTDDKSKENALYFQISLGGSFNDFMHFLKYVENAKYYIEVESLKISQVSEAGSASSDLGALPQGVVSSILNLKAFTD